MVAANGSRGQRRIPVGAAIRTSCTYAVLLALAVASVFPFLWMVSTSLKETRDLFTFPPQLIPSHPTFSNYTNILRMADFHMWLLNSVIVTAITTVFAIVFNSMAAYPLAMKEFPGRKVIFLLILSTLMVPAYVIMVPTYIMMTRLRLLNTYPGLIIPFTANAFGIFLMRQYMRTVPHELVDAAKIDGAREDVIFRRIVLPICKPAMSALTIFTFMSSWNNFIWPLILTTTGRMRTLPLGLALFQGENTTEWGLVMAGSTLCFVPVFVVFVVLQRYFVQGIAFTGIRA